MLRIATMIVMVSSFFVLGGLDCLAGNWRTGVACILLGVVQAIIFGSAK